MYRCTYKELVTSGYYKRTKNRKARWYNNYISFEIVTAVSLVTPYLQQPAYWQITSCYCE